MGGIESKSFDSPEETRQFQAHGHAEVLEMGGKTVLRSVFEPGWHWKDDIGPIAGTDTCQTHHFGYCVSGRMKIVMDDGTRVPVAVRSRRVAGLRGWMVERPLGRVDHVEGLDALGRVVSTITVIGGPDDFGYSIDTCLRPQE